MKIREDMTGVVTAYDEAGTLVVLKSGDDVPAGVEVGEHVLEPAPKKATAKKAAAPKSNNN